MATWLCANGNRATVQSVHDASTTQNGDIIQIPNGTWTWDATKLNITKAVTLTSQSFQGATIIAGNLGSNATQGDSTIILNKSSSGSIRLSGLIITYNNNTLANHYIAVNGGWSPASHPVIIDNNIFYTSGAYNTTLSAEYPGVITLQTNGVVICWNDSYCDAGANAAADGSGAGIYDPGFVQAQYGAALDQSWQTLDTMGTNDTTGWYNSYIEYNNFYSHTLNTIDWSDNSRLVVRNNNFISSSMSSHGQDSGQAGGRHLELYNNTFTYPTTGTDWKGYKYPLGQAFGILWRAATGIITGNVLPSYVTSTWGNKPTILFCVFNTCETPSFGTCQPTPPPAARQVGQTWIGTLSGYVSYSYPNAPSDGPGYYTDPVYIWNNTGAGNYTAANPPAVGDQNSGQQAICTGYVNWVTSHGGIVSGNNASGYSPPYATQFVRFGTDVKLDTAKTSGPTGAWVPYTNPHPLNPGQGSSSGGGGSGTLVAQESSAPISARPIATIDSGSLMAQENSTPVPAAPINLKAGTLTAQENTSPILARPHVIIDSGALTAQESTAAISAAPVVLAIGDSGILVAAEMVGVPSALALVATDSGGVTASESHAALSAAPVLIIAPPPPPPTTPPGQVITGSVGIVQFSLAGPVTAYSLGATCDQLSDDGDGIAVIVMYESTGGLGVLNCQLTDNFNNIYLLANTASVVIGQNTYVAQSFVCPSLVTTDDGTLLTYLATLPEVVNNLEVQFWEASGVPYAADLTGILDAGCTNQGNFPTGTLNPSLPVTVAEAGELLMGAIIAQPTASYTALPGWQIDSKGTSRITFHSATAPAVGALSVAPATMSAAKPAAMLVIGFQALQLTISRPVGKKAFLPGGLFELRPSTDTVDALAASPSWTNPSIAGFAIRLPWSTIETAPGVYQFGYIAFALSQAAYFGKAIGILVTSGSVTPQWFYTLGGETFFCTGIGNIPAPWDPIFLERWQMVLTALGNQYDQNPNLAYIVETGVGANAQGVLCYSNADNAALNARGGIQLWENAFLQVINIYRQAFPNTPVISNKGPPMYPNQNAGWFSATQEALDAYGAPYGIKDNGLSTHYSTTQQMAVLIGALALTNPGGFQELQPVASAATVATELAIGLQIGGQWVEMYPGSIAAANPSDLAYYNAAYLALAQAQFPILITPPVIPPLEWDLTGDIVLPPYCGQNQTSLIEGAAAAPGWEDGPTVVAPYPAPAPLEEDWVPPPVKQTDIFTAQQTFPL